MLVQCGRGCEQQPHSHSLGARLPSSAPRRPAPSLRPAAAPAGRDAQASVQRPPPAPPGRESGAGQLGGSSPEGAGASELPQSDPAQPPAPAGAGGQAGESSSSSAASRLASLATPAAAPAAAGGAARRSARYGGLVLSSSAILGAAVQLSGKSGVRTMSIYAPSRCGCLRSACLHHPTSAFAGCTAGVAIAPVWLPVLAGGALGGLYATLHRLCVRHAWRAPKGPLTVVVTGGARGIGKALAREFLRCPWAAILLLGPPFLKKDLSTGTAQPLRPARAVCAHFPLRLAARAACSRRLAG